MIVCFRHIYHILEMLSSWCRYVLEPLQVARITLGLTRSHNSPQRGRMINKVLRRARYMFTTKAYSAQSETSPLAPFSFQRRDPRPQDVQIEILYCGVCHSDLHQVRNEWHNTTYPCVPGHEIIGRVVKV